MKIKLNQQLKGVDNKSPIIGERNEPLMLRNICINAVLAPVEGEDQKKKWEKYEIFKKLRDANNEVDLKAEEVVIIKNGIGKFNPPLIMGQCFEMLESNK